MIPTSPIASYKLLDFYVDLETAAKEFLGLFETQDARTFLVVCQFSSNIQIPSVISSWHSIAKHIVSVKPVYLSSECPVCLEEFQSSTDVMILKCSHCVCQDCHKQISSCPLCKSKDFSIVAKIPNCLQIQSTEASSLVSVSDILGYKVVGIMIQQNPFATVQFKSPDSKYGQMFSNGILLSKVSALLSLQIEHQNALVYSVESGKGIVPFNQIRPKVKYCSNAVRCISARFIGDSQQINQALMCYQTGNARFVSYHDKQTEYHINKCIRVPTAGQGCGNSRCGQGLYFFTDVPSTLDFWGSRNSCVSSHNPSTPWMSEPVLFSNGFRAIKLPKKLKHEIQHDNYLTNERQLREWCDSHRMDLFSEDDQDFMQCK